MELKNQVTSLELSKKLKKLGVEQESIWKWVTKGQNSKEYILVSSQKFQIGYSAFTVAELGELLPDKISNSQWSGNIRLPSKVNKLWVYSRPLLPTSKLNIGITSEKTEANARAAMMIYLLENKLI